MRWASGSSSFRNSLSGVESCLPAPTAGVECACVLLSNRPTSPRTVLSSVSPVRKNVPYEGDRYDASRRSIGVDERLVIGLDDIIRVLRISPSAQPLRAARAHPFLHSLAVRRCCAREKQRENDKATPHASNLSTNILRRQSREQNMP